ncbi:MAG: XisI protein [Symploca sp. SIO1C2]|nr:XisI protein [Symploca sp. SIO1C2]
MLLHDLLPYSTIDSENLIAQELADLGIPKTDIVLGFHAPFERQSTEYALG